jgi:hypothetical protein
MVRLWIRTKGVYLANPAQDELRQRSAELREALGDLRDAFFGFLRSRKLQSALLSTFAFIAFTGILGFLSIPIYGAVYHFHLPDQVVEVPVYLQYGLVWPLVYGR